MIGRFFCCACASLVLLSPGSSSSVQAQPAAPKPPAKYRAVIRYRIIAPRDPHVALYDALVAHLKTLDFEFTPPLPAAARNTDREDPTKDRLVGLVPSSKALDIPRNPSVASLLLIPEKLALPDDPRKPVRIRIELASGLAPDRQRELFEQTAMVLRHVLAAKEDESGFEEAVAYDQRGHTGRPFTRLVGTVPAGQLALLLKDPRRLPTSWLSVQSDPADLPLPLRTVSPIRVIEVLDSQPLVEAPADAREKSYLYKITPDLWKLVEDKAQARRTLRVQLVLTSTPGAGNPSWRNALGRAVPDLFVESQLGPFVTAQARLGDVRTLAALPQVSGIRLPPPARVNVDPGIAPKGDNAQVLRRTGLQALDKRGFRGQGVRLAIVDTDFRGYENLVAAKQLPARTRLIDLTVEKDPDLYAEPMPGDPKQLGHGTLCARAAAIAAPDADLVLIRVDGDDPEQLRQVIRLIAGDSITPYMERRRGELLSAKGALRAQRELIMEERRRILRDFTDDADQRRAFGYLGAAYGWVFNSRDWSVQRLAWQQRQEKIFSEREQRFWNHYAALRSLKGIAIVATPLVWHDGYPLGSASAISRWLDERTPSRDREGAALPRDVAASSRSRLGDFPLCFQSIGNTRGQAWTGLFQDADGNGVMEFAPPRTPLKPGRWNHELNFLAWQPYQGKRVLDLPAQTRLRISVQWREPHDPDYFVRAGAKDAYRRPLADLSLVVLRQRDPEGKGEAADLFDVVARSPILPERLDNRPNASTYEQSVAFTVDKPGRYAVRIERMRPTQWDIGKNPTTGHWTLERYEGLTSSGIRPAGVATLPSTEKNWELRPRLFVQAVDDAQRLKGRPVWLDYTTDLGTLGTPADARQVIAVGAANPAGEPQPYTPIGAPANLELHRQPAVYMYDDLQLGPEGTGGAYGSSIATCFAAGWAADLLSSGMSPQQVYQLVQKQKGKVLRLP